MYYLYTPGKCFKEKLFHKDLVNVQNIFERYSHMVDGTINQGVKNKHPYGDYKIYKIISDHNNDGDYSAHIHNYHHIIDGNKLPPLSMYRVSSMCLHMLFG